MTPPPPAETAPPPAATPDAERGAERVNLYVPRILQQHLVDHPETRGWTVEGTAAFVDISGFTKLSEQLARKGKEGAEQITEVIGKSFESILQVAYDRGGSLLKFGGDALLLWFEGDSHVERACHATLMMRAVLDDVGRIKLPDAEVTLQMSQGVHSGRVPLLRGRRVAHGAAAHRSRLEPAGGDGADGQRRRDPALHRDRRAAPARVPGRAQGPGTVPGGRPGRRADAAARAAPAHVHRPARALPAARGARLRARRRAARRNTGR